MIKIKVADFLIENLVGDPETNSKNFCLSLAIFYTTSDKNNIDDLEIDDMDYFNLILGTPLGLNSYFESLLNKSEDELVFFPHCAIVKQFDKEKILNAIKIKLESIVGKNERYMIANALIYFDWQYQDDFIEMNKLFG
ncbi:MAG: hypothetical protein GXC73_16965 [Chitinophagaceae bacterium]|nr:hypothetical protein [Chitinophagaceae bacterium]